MGRFRGRVFHDRIEFKNMPKARTLSNRGRWVIFANFDCQGKSLGTSELYQRTSFDESEEENYFKNVNLNNVLYFSITPPFNNNVVYTWRPKEGKALEYVNW
jgi:hypothetical protein